MTENLGTFKNELFVSTRYKEIHYKEDILETY